MALTAALSTAPTADRNDYTGGVGYRFAANRDLTITALGRPVGSIFSQSHRVSLWTNSGTLLGDVTVTTSSPTENGWAYEMLGSAVSLTNGTSYRIASAEVSGGDNWKEQSTITGVDTSWITVLYGCYENNSGTGYPDEGAGYERYEQGYVWANLYEGSSGVTGNPLYYYQNQAAVIA